MLRSPSGIAPCALLSVLCLACAKGPPSGGAGTYRGLATNVNEIGVLEVTVEDAAKGPLPASGTLRFPSKTVELTGTLDKSKTLLLLTSSDGYTLEGESRPTYVYGAYRNANNKDDVGMVGLVLQGAASEVGLFCGSMVNTADVETQGVTLPLGVTGVPGGDAICIGPNFAWLGGFSTDSRTLACGSGTVAIDGDVNATSGNKWGTGTNYGTWTVTPCASNGAGGDGGVPDGAPDSGASN